MWQYKLPLSSFSWQVRVFLTAVCLLVVWLLLPSTPLHTHAQQRAVAPLEKVSTTSTTAQVLGPFPGGEQETKPFSRLKTRLDDENWHGAQTSTSSAISPAGDISQAGPSAIAALKKIHPETSSLPQSLANFGESLFSGESQRSPAPTTVWAKGASLNNKDDDDVIDPQIAVNDSRVGILTWDDLVFYDKSGNPTSHWTIENLFAHAVKVIEEHLNLNPVVANNPQFHINEVGDARIAFDAQRKRWLVVATAKNIPDDKLHFPISLVRSQRRTKILFAISKDEVPTGFITYVANGTPDDGACDAITDQMCPNSAFRPGLAGDYPSVGVSADKYLVTVHVGYEPLDGSDGQALYAYMVVFDANDVENGLHKEGTARAMWAWQMAGGGSAKGVTMPVHMHQTLPNTDAALIVNTNDDKFIITSVAGDTKAGLGSIALHIADLTPPGMWDQKGSFEQINYGNEQNVPHTSTLIGNKLFAAIDDCRKWFDSQKVCSPSIHLFSVDMSRFPVTSSEMDRIFGGRSSLDDAPDDIVGYGNPGVAVNVDGDLVVVYNRTSHKIFSEVRYSTWLHNEVDLRPSQLLRKGDGPMPVSLLTCAPPNSCKGKKLDTAGVALDPFDNKAIWIAHLFANSTGGWSVAVGKVFGQRHPDLRIHDDLTFTPSSAHPGAKLQVKYTITNGGDGPAGKPQVSIILISENGTRTIVDGRLQLELAAGDTRKMSYNVQLPSKLAAGTYAVHAEAEVPEREYTNTNNRANASVKIKVTSK